jgi:SAM-dependent methyltransferase
VLDLGTGPGGALVAAAGARCVGVDLSLAWLVVARRRLAGLGLDALLVAADACRLPVASGAFDLVLAFDLLEHVQDPRAMLGEACRVLSPEGRVVATTPNRLSLGPDPHHGLWGVGWLPRRLGRRWVAWRLGRPERFVTSESRRAIRRLAGRAGEIRIEHPPIPSEDLALFAPGKRALARLYNGLLALPGVSLALGPVAPFYRVTVRPAHGDGAAGDAEAARARRPGGES